MAATLAIGQANLTSGSPNQGGATPTSATLSDPAYPVFDTAGNLWVSDFFNNRLLESATQRLPLRSTATPKTWSMPRAFPRLLALVAAAQLPVVKSG